MYSYRLTVCDHYMSSPIRGLDITYSEFKGTEIRQVPIVRIFGSTIDGQKACLHIHGVFPYIYIPYEGSEPPDRLKYQIAASLDKAINISLGQANASTQHVFKIILVSGIPFYGYHEKEHQFFKIYFFNPHIIKKATDLLQNGAVLGKVHQPHEAHVPFILQFMIDYNLQGMNLVNCSNVLHRQHPKQHAEWEEDSPTDENSTPVSSNAPLRVSCCEIEVDVAASNILNRSDVLNQSVDNPGIAALWEDEYQRRREQGKDTQPTPQTSQIRESKLCASEEFYRQRLLLRLEEMTQSTDESYLTQPTQGGSGILYPAEVSEGQSLLDASYVDPHTPHKLSKLMEYSREELEKGAEPSTSANFSQLMDSQDEDLLNVLGELAMSQEEDDQPVVKPDEDSIISSQEPDKLLLISQQGTEVKEDEEDEYFEMTQPMSALLTPQQQRNPVYDESTIIDESSSETLIAASDDKNMPSISGIEREIQTSQTNLIDSSQSSLTTEDKSDQLEILDEESNSQNYTTSQTSLNASLLSELLNEDLWTDVKNVPQNDGIDDDPIPSTSPIKKTGRRLGARGPLIPMKPTSSPLLTNQIPNSPSSSHSSVHYLSSDNSSPSLITALKGKIATLAESLSQNSDSDIELVNISQSSENLNSSQVVEINQENQDDNLPDTQLLVENNDNNSSISHLSSTDFNILLNVVESQQNLSPVDKVIESSNPNSRNPTENQSTTEPISEQLVTGLCSVLSWSEGETESLDLENNSSIYSDLFLPEGTTAMQLLEEELTENNTEKNLQSKKETIKIRKSKRLSLRPNQRYRLKDLYNIVGSSTNRNIVPRKPSTSNVEASTSNDTTPRNRTPQKSNSQDDPLPSTSSGGYISPISWRLRKKNSPDEISQSIPVSINIKEKEETIVKVLNLPKRKRGRPSESDPMSLKRQKINLEIDMPRGKITNMSVQFKPRSVSKKQITLSYDVESNKKTNKSFKNLMKQYNIRPCSINVEKLNDDFIEKALKVKNKSSSSQESVVIVEEIEHDISKENQSSSPDFIPESPQNSNTSDQECVLNPSFLEKVEEEKISNNQELKSEQENKVDSQEIENPHTSQSSNASSKNEPQDSKMISPIKKTQSPPKKRLVSKLKSSLSLGKPMKRVSFNTLDIIIEKSPIKKVENQESPEKQVPRRKLNYQLSSSSKASTEIKPNNIESESDSDIIENSDDDTLEPKFIQHQTKSLTKNTIQNSDKNPQSSISIKLPKIQKQSQKSKKKFFLGQENSSESELSQEISAHPLETKSSKKSVLKEMRGNIRRNKSISESTDDSKTSQSEVLKIYQLPSTSTMEINKNISYEEDSKNSFTFDSTSSESKNELSFIEEEEEDCENRLGIESFYNLTQSQFLSPVQEESYTEISSQETPKIEVNLDVTPHSPIKPNTVYEPIYNPPNYTEVIETLKENNLQELKHQEPYYSLSSDVQAKSKEIGGRIMKLISHSACDLPEYQSNIVDTHIKTTSDVPLTDIIYIEPLLLAPTYKEVASYKTEEKNEKTPKKDTSLLRIRVPNSPGRENSDDDESLSLSPCSDVQSQSWNPISPVGSSSQQSRSKSPLVHSTPMPNKALAKCMTPRRLSANSDSCCRLDGPSPLNNTFGFRVALENLQDARAVIQPQQLTVFALELHISTRGELRPDPDTDPVGAAFFLVSRDDGLGSQEMGVIAVQSDKTPLLSETRSKCKVTRVEDEKALVMKILEVVKMWDPDILLGYEIEMASWGYLIQRAAYLEMNLANLLSRVQKPDKGPTMRPLVLQDETATTTSGQKPVSQGVAYEPSELKVVGRIILNLWRIMKHEVAVQSYVFENMAYHILHERIPQHSFQTLTFWWNHPSKRYLWLVTDYWLYRVEGCSRLLAQLDVLGRTSELAKLFGIQFYEVLSRGSQFRVESMMLRLAKPRNFVPVSPSIMQRAHMKAPEYIPLILEPESKYYEDPVIVLDFQSLYPSMIIAYNYCFSTCLGRVEHLGQDGPFQFGCTQLLVPPKLVRKMSQCATISPCGVAYVKRDIREGVLPRMLKEILDTRLMVKKSMKENKKDSLLQRVLHARQLGLKLIANVTYGYTAANFSGRMPCIEVGDSVVSKGRETLDRAIQMVHQREAEWGARVVYGDTDSMFVLVPGRTRQQAFEIGAEIAAAVTADNPSPVKLKLEKVYHPCILQTKKRYVGYMYESPDQKEPVYEAKGIETVRRDGCPAVAKMLEKSLRMLFETQDVSFVKSYVVRQYQKLLLGRSNLQDLVFAKEFRGFTGYKPGACVPALELTRQWLRVDRRAEPRTGERVPYVVVNGAPGLPLIRLVRSPHDLLRDNSLRINAEYYITRAIAPALDRCFSLLGADVHQWYAEMPRRTISGLPTCNNTTGGTVRLRGTISQYFATVECAVCRQQTREGLCIECQTEPQKSALVLSDKLRRWERAVANIAKICSSCCGRSYETTCCSLVCPILFRRNQADRDVEQAPFVRQLFDKFLEF